MSIHTEIEKAEAIASAFFVATNRDDAPRFEITIYPYNSLAPRGFVWLFGIIGVAFLIPLGAFLGSVLLWGLLLPIVTTIAALWYFIKRNYRDRSVHEVIRLWPNLIAVERCNPRAAHQYWHANPFWVTIQMRDTRTHKNYLTIKSKDREIELGSFLAPQERADLKTRLERELNRLNINEADDI